MLIKRYKGKIHGASFTANEQKAANIEIGRQLAEYTRKHNNEVDAAFLWAVHEEFGYGKKRLKRLYKRFSARINTLITHYELGDLDRAWICQHLLKKYGIDIEEWAKEEKDNA